MTGLKSQSSRTCAQRNEDDTCGQTARRVTSPTRPGHNAMKTYRYGQTVKCVTTPTRLGPSPRHCPACRNAARARPFVPSLLAHSSPVYLYAYIFAESEREGETLSVVRTRRRIAETCTHKDITSPLSLELIMFAYSFISGVGEGWLSVPCEAPWGSMNVIRKNRKKISGVLSCMCSFIGAGMLNRTIMFTSQFVLARVALAGLPNCSR